MTEEQWLASDDPQLVLDGLPLNASRRNLRLFACACCRRLWDFLVDERSRVALGVLEQFVDDLAGLTSLARAHEAAPQSGPDCSVLGDNSDHFYDAANAVVSATLSDRVADRDRSNRFRAHLLGNLWRSRHVPGIGRRLAERRVARILRQPFGVKTIATSVRQTQYN